MRDVLTFTIDPADARDFDDALSFESLPVTGDGVQTYQIGVHIADVSYYVKPGSKEDEDAYRRGTSVYLVDKVLPMLPERLCNDICSLWPNTDKLCMSVVFTMDSDAQVLKYKICRTVIRSDARLNYEEAQAMIEGERTEVSDERLAEALTVLNSLAQKLRSRRIADGAITIEQPEMRFRLDVFGRPVEIFFETTSESHQLIEEFMLLANRTVARAVGSGRPFIYRVHDLPNEERLSELREFKRRMGNRVQQSVIDMLAIRAQAKAVYSTHNIGHYGLAFSHYTHFTSPIRRYPDLMVHRLVDKYILTGKPVSWSKEELEEIAEHCSACEQEAQQAERDSIKLFQAMFMADHVGEEMLGHISSVTEFGFFVQLDENLCEGLVHVSTIGNGEYWTYDEKNYRLVSDSGSYTIGEAVRVKVVHVDTKRAQIDFVLA